MCLRPQLCVCKPGTKGKACEKTAAQDTTSPVFGGQSLGAASSWSASEQVAKHTVSKKADTLPRVSPVAQMTLTLKPKPSVGLSRHHILIKTPRWYSEPEEVPQAQLLILFITVRIWVTERHPTSYTPLTPISSGKGLQSS